MIMMEFDLRSMWWPDRKRSYCISIDPYRLPEHIYCVFIALACLCRMLLPKNCWWPFMTWNDLGDMKRGHYSLAAIFRFRASSIPINLCLKVFRMVFIKKLWDKRSTCIDTVTDNNICKFQCHQSGEAMTSNTTFSGLRSLEVTWWPDLEWPGSNIFILTLGSKRRERLRPTTTPLGLVRVTRLNPRTDGGLSHLRPKGRRI